MSVSDVAHSVTHNRPFPMIVDVTARGGTRRERGAAIAAFVRHYPLGRLVLINVSYSETYGFLPATYARYHVVS